MAAYIKPYYDKRTEDIRSKIDGGIYTYIINKYYKSDNGKFYYYINSKGYYHIIRPRRVSFMEKHFFEIVDYMLTKEGAFKETGSHGNYKVLETCIAAIEENLAPNAYTIETLWTAACNGDIETLKSYYENRGRI